MEYPAQTPVRPPSKAPHSKVLSLLRSLLLSSLFSAVCSLSAVQASTSSYYLDSSRLELQVSPATGTASGAVKVSSNSNRPIRLKVIPRLWHLTPQGVLVYDDTPTGNYNLLEHIGINPEEFELLPGKSRLVRFIVKVPSEVTPAEYPFQLYFQPTTLLESENKQDVASVNNILDVVPIFTTTVYAYQGNPQPANKIDTFQCGYLPQNKQFSVHLELSNSGSKHARLFGNVVINRKEATGGSQLLEVLHLQNSTLIVVFPGQSRIVDNTLESEKGLKLEAGNYEMELRLVDERNQQPALQSTCNFTVPAS